MPTPATTDTLHAALAYAMRTLPAAALVAILAYAMSERQHQDAILATQAMQSICADIRASIRDLSQDLRALRLPNDTNSSRK